MEYSKSELHKFLSLSNKKLKKLKRNIKNIRIERNRYKKKLDEIEKILNDQSNYTIYDYYPSESEYYKMEGKKALRDILLYIVEKWIIKRNIIYLKNS